jgi:DNA-binding transcriptional regulator YhcF (GntR family)
VRQLADSIGINMHTVNKAYSVLRQEGFVKVDRRKGAVIAIDIDKIQAVEDLKRDLQVLLAKSRCKRISRQEVHALIDEIYENYE